MKNELIMQRALEVLENVDYDNLPMKEQLKFTNAYMALISIVEYLERSDDKDES